MNICVEIKCKILEGDQCELEKEKIVQQLEFNILAEGCGLPCQEDECWMTYHSSEELGEPGLDRQHWMWRGHRKRRVWIRGTLGTRVSGGSRGMWLRPRIEKIKVREKSLVDLHKKPVPIRVKYQIIRCAYYIQDKSSLENWEWTWAHVLKKK